MNLHLRYGVVFEFTHLEQSNCEFTRQVPRWFSSLVFSLSTKAEDLRHRRTRPQSNYCPAYPFQLRPQIALRQRPGLFGSGDFSETRRAFKLRRRSMCPNMCQVGGPFARKKMVLALWFGDSFLLSLDLHLPLNGVICTAHELQHECHSED